ncbi:MAG: type II secretion system F family protein [Nanoarchaeota archaeon]|mgnify:CR=1 FL=1
MRLKKMHWFGIIIAVVVVIVDLIFFFNDERMLFFLIGIAWGIAALPFVVGLTLENKKEQQINEMFLEFTRNLAESVSTGTPISRSVINIRKKNYGVLNPYLTKLSNQIELGVSVDVALQNFSSDVNSSVIKRAVALIREAEKAGGEIDYILDSTAKSISEVEKLKKERKSAIYNLVVQGYVIFFLFLGIILVMEFRIIPLTSGIGGIGGFDFSVSSLEQQSSSEEIASSTEQFSKSFLYLILAQGFFIGLTIGKLAEGSIKSGIKHSFILMTIAFLVSTGSKLFLSTPSA